MRKRYLDEQKGAVLGDVWTDISQLRGVDKERLGYPTQKPLALLERIIEASSNPGDIVLDAFCGCGTTVTAAHKLGRRWIGIDVTTVAITIVKTRLEQMFAGEGLKVPVEGFPVDLQGAHDLFEQDTHKFQQWACTLVGAYPLMKKGADKGIDGWLHFSDYDESDHRAVVQVKGGKNIGVKDIRDFCHVVTREKATLGFFLCLGDVTAPMEKEAINEGLWESASGKDYPRVQILQVADILSGKVQARYPLPDKKSLLGFKAKKTDKKGLQQELF